MISFKQGFAFYNVEGGYRLAREITFSNGSYLVL